MDIASLIILTAVAVAFINTAYAMRYKIVNMPSTKWTRTAIIDDLILTKQTCDHLVIYDCGSGWGGLCHKLSTAFPKAHITGIEISPIPFLVSFFSPWRRYSVKRADLFQEDFSAVDVIVLYLSPYHADQFSKRQITDFKNGAIIYSQGFPIKTLTPTKEIDVPYSIEKTLYRYDIKHPEQSL